MFPRPPRSKRTYPLFPYTTLFRSDSGPLLRAEKKPRLEGTHGPVEFQVDPDTARNPPACTCRHCNAPAVSEREPCIRKGDVSRVTRPPQRSEEHTSELQSLMRTSYAVFCLKKKTKQIQRK